MTWQNIMKKDYVDANDELDDLEYQMAEYKRLALAIGQIADVTIEGYTYADMPADKKEVFDMAVNGMEEMQEKFSEAEKAYNDAIADMAALLGESDNGMTLNSAQDIKDFIKENM